MMENTELINNMRACIRLGVLIDDCDITDDCHYSEDGECGDCMLRMVNDAADALEAADEKIADYIAAVEALDDSNDAYIKENERLKKRIEELEAQLQKEGEWLRTDAFPHRIYCSVCYKTYVPNDRWQIWVDDELPKNYCPNCGAKMQKGEQE